MASILIMDDIEDVRELLVDTMDYEGYDVVDAVNGRLGLMKFRQRPTDVVLTDIVMPEMNGLEFIEQIREHYPNTIIIAMSGYGSNQPGDGLYNAKQLGADCILKKPFALDDMIALVSAMLAERGIPTPKAGGAAPERSLQELQAG